MVTKNEIKNALNGEEIISTTYEGVVGVEGNNLVKEGKVIKTLKTKKEWCDLLHEHAGWEIPEERVKEAKKIFG